MVREREMRRVSESEMRRWSEGHGQVGRPDMIYDGQIDTYRYSRTLKMTREKRIKRFEGLYNGMNREDLEGTNTYFCVFAEPKNIKVIDDIHKGTFSLIVQIDEGETQTWGNIGGRFVEFRASERYAKYCTRQSEAEVYDALEAYDSEALRQEAINKWKNYREAKSKIE